MANNSCECSSSRIWRFLSSCSLVNLFLVRRDILPLCYSYPNVIFAVAKVVEPMHDPELNMPIGDRINLCYSSTVVTKGRGTGIVFGTGMKTEVGKIAEAMGNKKPKNVSAKARVADSILSFLGLRNRTPLQIKLSKLAYILFGCAIILAIIVFGAARFDITNEVILYAIAVAIAIIPESLIAVLTLTMAVGTKRMAKANVIVRKLDALENLGGVTDICSDKTGTLTLGTLFPPVCSATRD